MAIRRPDTMFFKKLDGPVGRKMPPLLFARPNLQGRDDLTVQNQVPFRDAARLPPVRPLQSLRLMQGFQGTVDCRRADAEERRGPPDFLPSRCRAGRRPASRVLSASSVSAGMRTPLFAIREFVDIDIERGA